MGLEELREQERSAAQAPVSHLPVASLGAVEVAASPLQEQGELQKWAPVDRWPPGAR